MATKCMQIGRTLFMADIGAYTAGFSFYCTPCGFCEYYNYYITMYVDRRKIVGKS